MVSDLSIKQFHNLKVCLAIHVLQRCLPLDESYWTKKTPKPENKTHGIFLDFLVLLMIEVELEALFVQECNFDIAALF